MAVHQVIRTALNEHFENLDEPLTRIDQSSAPGPASVSPASLPGMALSTMAPSMHETGGTMQQHLFRRQAHVGMQSIWPH